LHFIAGCVRPGRIFVSRLLNWLRSAFPSDTVGNKQKIYRYIPIEIQDSTSSEIFTTLSGVTSSVIFSESNVTPIKVIFVVGVTALSTDSSKPQDINNSLNVSYAFQLYLRKEASYGSIIGPFESNPFDCQFKISPLNSVTKRNSSERTASPFIF
jgi:hypothetical protein